MLTKIQKAEIIYKAFSPNAITIIRSKAMFQKSLLYEYIEDTYDIENIKNKTFKALFELNIGDVFKYFKDKGLIINKTVYDNIFIEIEFITDVNIHLIKNNPKNLIVNKEIFFKDSLKNIYENEVIFHKVVEVVNKIPNNELSEIQKLIKQYNYDNKINIDTKYLDEVIEQYCI